MFIFYFLGVGLPCRSILCQFWLCEEAQCVYLCRHLGSHHHVRTLNRGTHKRMTISIQGALSPYHPGHVRPLSSTQVPSLFLFHKLGNPNVYRLSSLSRIVQLVHGGAGSWSWICYTACLASLGSVPKFLLVTVPRSSVGSRRNVEVSGSLTPSPSECLSS